MRGGEDFAAVSAAFKRMKNILAQAREKCALSRPLRACSGAAGDPGEWELTKQSGELAGRVEGFRSKKDYRGALEQIATLRPIVDGFFDTVMVMALEEDRPREPAGAAGAGAEAIFRGSQIFRRL